MKNMEAIKKALELVQPTVTLPESELFPTPNYECEECSDTGRVYFREGKYEFHRKCVCAIEKIRRQKLAVIPPVFRGASLENIQPQPHRHSLQSELVPKMKARPGDSYFLSGKFGTGKTFLMWALYREAVMRDRRVVFSTLTGLMEEFRKFIRLSQANQPLVYPQLSADALRQDHTKFSIFLDDVDKARPTEFVGEQFFEIADAIYAYGHQIVVTTNLSAEDLGEYFERADPQFGPAIMRRLTTNATVAEMF